MKRLLAKLLTLSLLTMPATHAKETELTLYNFNDKSATPEWKAENDGVMGGVSSGTGKIQDGHLVFAGSLSLENDGGFASLQTDDGSWDLSNAKSIKLRIKGDGRTYQFRLATDAENKGSRIDYAANFKTKANEWTEVSVPFSEMKPTWRGEKLDGPELNLKNIRQLRIFLGDKKEGSFKLQVDWITTSAE